MNPLYENANVLTIYFFSAILKLEYFWFTFNCNLYVNLSDTYLFIYEGKI